MYMWGSIQGFNEEFRIMKPPPVWCSFQKGQIVHHQMLSEEGCELQTMQHNMAAFASHIAQSATQHVHNQNLKISSFLALHIR